MRNLAGDVVQNMSLGNTVRRMSTDPAHEAAEVTQKAAVQSGKSSASEGELRSTVVREERVGVLQEGDQNQPVVDPTIEK